MENMNNKTESELNAQIKELAPAWCGDIDTWEEVQAIQRGGCASGAYMPAVTYRTAVERMTEHDSAVMNYLDDMGVDLGSVNEHPSFAAIAVRLLSTAVECWADSLDLEDMVSEIEGADWGVV